MKQFKLAVMLILLIFANPHPAHSQEICERKKLALNYWEFKGNCRIDLNAQKVKMRLRSPQEGGDSKLLVRFGADPPDVWLITGSLRVESQERMVVIYWDKEQGFLTKGTMVLTTDSLGILVKVLTGKVDFKPAIAYPSGSRQLLMLSELEEVALVRNPIRIDYIDHGNGQVEWPPKETPKAPVSKEPSRQNPPGVEPPSKGCTCSSTGRPNGASWLVFLLLLLTCPGLRIIRK